MDRHTKLGPPVGRTAPEPNTPPGHHGLGYDPLTYKQVEAYVGLACVAELATAEPSTYPMGSPSEASNEEESDLPLEALVEWWDGE